MRLCFELPLAADFILVCPRRQLQWLHLNPVVEKVCMYPEYMKMDYAAKVAVPAFGLLFQDLQGGTVLYCQYGMVVVSEVYTVVYVL